MLFRSIGIFYNPASIHNQYSLQLHIFHANPYGLDELYLSSVAAAWSRARYTLAAAVKSLANPAYQELQLYLGYMYRLPMGIDAGCCLRYGSVAIKNYGRGNSFILDLGAQYNIISNIRYGFSITNVNYARLGRCREKVPQIIRTGVTVTAIERTSLSMDFVKDPRFPPDIRIGVEYHIFERFYLRAGSALMPSRWSAGFTVKLSICTLDYAYKSHIELGLTHLFSMQFDWKQELE